MFAGFFTLVAAGQYLFVRFRTYRDTERDLTSQAKRVVEAVGPDWASLDAGRRSDLPIPRCLILTQDGQVLSLTGFVPGVPSRVSLPAAVSSTEPVTVTNEVGEQFRVLVSRWRGRSFLVSSQIDQNEESDSDLRE